jgi:cytochrome c oxidase subunit IV
MTTTADSTHTPDAHHDPHDAAGNAPDSLSSHKTTGYYVIVALILAVITAIETSTYWINFGPLFMPTLLILMTIKFFMVVMLFMHLKFDNKAFWYLFLAGLGLAVVVYVGMLLSFEFFTPS